jgi:hypothetical protein
MKVNNYPLKTPSAGDKLFGSDSVGNQKQFDMSAVSNNVFKYQIGEYVADEGGVIAHRWLSDVAGGSPISGSFENYLVIDTNDLTPNASWATLNVNISNVESQWNGLLNTTNLIFAGDASGITAGTAAVLCDTSSNNGQTDWYLPAIDELSKIWQNKWEIAQGLDNAGGSQLATEIYWSSTERNSMNAWYASFAFGDFIYAPKGDGYYVRAVRKFSI